MVPMTNGQLEGIKMQVPTKIENSIVTDEQVVKKTTEVHSRPH